MDIKKNNIMCNKCYTSKIYNEFYKGSRVCKECTRTTNKKAYRVYYEKNGRKQIKNNNSILGYGLKVLFN